ncbi:MAG: hypothetical protein ACFFB5_13575 [Promethearchaeota archaeon]
MRREVFPYSDRSGRLISESLSLSVDFLGLLPFLLLILRLALPGVFRSDISGLFHQASPLGVIQLFFLKPAYSSPARSTLLFLEYP